MKHYDFIFAGAGLSSLLTLHEMIVSQKFKGKTILLLDESAKNENDRTWCFWENEAGEFEPILHKKWDTAVFANQDFTRDLALHPYQYKMLRAKDFYEQIFTSIARENNITFLNQKVISYREENEHVFVTTATETFRGNKLFNSIFNIELIKNQRKYPLLQQHFIGWFVRTKEAVFTPDKVIFMDFSVTQKGNTRFMYVLPISENEALVEYTLFSKDVLSKQEYESEIVQYLKIKGVTEYEILEKEQGNIPMTCYPFWKNNTKNIVNIGSAGGWTKASTGYTFKNSTKKAKQLVAFLSANSDFRKLHKTSVFWWYDLLFIDVLYKNNALGNSLFSSLFKKGNPLLVFQFLDEETSILQDIRFILRCPKIPFVKALWDRVFS